MTQIEIIFPEGRIEGDLTRQHLVQSIELLKRMLREQLKQDYLSFRQQAETLGVSLETLSGGESGVRGGPVFVHPHNPALVWNGRGRRPNWVRTFFPRAGEVGDPGKPSEEPDMATPATTTPETSTGTSVPDVTTADGTSLPETEKPETENSAIQALSVPSEEPAPSDPPAADPVSDSDGSDTDVNTADSPVGTAETVVTAEPSRRSPSRPRTSRPDTSPRS